MSKVKITTEKDSYTSDLLRGLMVEDDIVYIDSKDLTDDHYMIRLSKWHLDIKQMHSHYGAKDAIKDFDVDKLKKLLEFRIKFLQEELTELKDAEGPEDVVDALVDLVVVAIGTLDLFDIDMQKAWDAVHKANMAKEVGIKESRPNPLGLPDLIKPSTFVSPDHTGNVGTLSKIKFYEK